MHIINLSPENAKAIAPVLQACGERGLQFSINSDDHPLVVIHLHDPVCGASISACGDTIVQACEDAMENLRAHGHV